MLEVRLQGVGGRTAPGASAREQRVEQLPRVRVSLVGCGEVRTPSVARDAVRWAHRILAETLFHQNIQ